jgi:hypothetical protein
MDNVIRGGNWYWDIFNAWRVLEEVETPALKRATDKFTPSGHHLGVQWPEEFEPLTAKIKHKTNDPEIRGLCGREPGNWVQATYYENLTSFRTGESRGRICVLKGLINEVKQAAVKGLKISGVEYEFSTIVYYHDMYDGRTVHKFDYFVGPPGTIVNGSNPFGAMATNLAIAGGVQL